MNTLDNEKLLSYVQGDLDAADRQQVETLLHTSAETREMVRLLTLARQTIHEMTDLLPSPDYLEGYAKANPFAEEPKPRIIEVPEISELLEQIFGAAKAVFAQLVGPILIPSPQMAGLRVMQNGHVATPGAPAGFIYRCDSLEIKLTTGDRFGDRGMTVHGTLDGIDSFAGFTVKTASFVHDKWDSQTAELNELGDFTLSHLPLRPDESFALDITLNDRTIHIKDIQFSAKS